MIDVLIKNERGQDSYQRQRVDAVGSPVLEHLSPARPVIPDRQFLLRDFGAVADGRTSNTEVFRRAVAAVEQAGGGRLVVPAGTYATGPISLCSRLDLHLERDATLLFSNQFSDYPRRGDRPQPLIHAAACHDLAISGAGTIDGNGQVWWDRTGEALARKNIELANDRPFLFVPEHCQRVLVSGVTLTRSPMFHFVPTFCEDVTAEGITIRAPAQAYNTDGINPSQTKRMLITRCTIDTGDDCVALKAGDTGEAPVEDILITDCTFLHGHGCSVGSATKSGVRRVLVRRCTFDSTDAGVRFKSNRLCGGTCEDVTFTDLVMRNVHVPLILYSYYPFPVDSGLPDVPAPGQHAVSAPTTATTPIWRRLTVRNVTATGAKGGAGLVMGLPEMPVQDVRLENVSIEGGYGLRIGYAKNVTLIRVQVTATHGEPLIIDDTVEGLQRVG